MKKVIRYSEAFKLQVVRELEAGKYPSCEAARKAYRIVWWTQCQGPLSKKLKV